MSVYPKSFQLENINNCGPTEKNTLNRGQTKTSTQNCGQTLQFLAQLKSNYLDFWQKLKENTLIVAKRNRKELWPFANSIEVSKALWRRKVPKRKAATNRRVRYLSQLTAKSVATTAGSSGLVRCSRIALVIGCNELYLPIVSLTTRDGERQTHSDTQRPCHLFVRFAY